MAHVANMEPAAPARNAHTALVPSIPASENEGHERHSSVQGRAIQARIVVEVRDAVGTEALHSAVGGNRR